MKHVKEGVTGEEINNLINAETWKNGEEWQEYFDIEVSEANHAVADRVLERMGGQESTKKPSEDTEKQAAEILEDLDYI